MDHEQPQKIKTHEDLRVYQMAFEAAIAIFELSKQFPIEERYSLTPHSAGCRRGTLVHAS